VKRVWPLRIGDVAKRPFPDRGIVEGALVIGGEVRMERRYAFGSVGLREDET